MLRNRIGRVFALSLTILSIFLGSTVTGAPVQPKGRKLLEDFDYHGVTLDGGLMRAQLDEVCEEYLRIPNDDLLKGFRQRAGLPAPGRDLGGWYSGDVFHVFGQIVSGLSRLYAATGNAACRDKANALVAEWGTCIGPDGYFYYSRKPNAPHYTYDKMLWGLLDAQHYCGNAQALGYASRITDWAIKHLDRERKYAFNQGNGNTEWYTLSENLYRAYLVSGEEKYRDFAAIWEYREYWDLYARKADLFGVRPNGQHSDAYHAYSHVNTLGGAGAAYLVKGDPHYLEVLRNAYDYLQANETFATGGFGPDEQLLPHDKLQAKLGASSNTFETQCGAWACFKMVKYLIACTADARYGDWAERLAINGIAASIHMTSSGRVFYYSDYCTEGGEKANHGTGWTCCTGTRPQAVADFCDLIYFKDADNLYVNLFAPSTVRWPHGGADVTVRQTTRFPENGYVEFTLQSPRPTEFGLKIRNPRWLAGPMTARLNGESVSLVSDASHWNTLRRVWKNGDRLAIVLPMRLAVSRFTPGQPYPAAMVFGPVVLAARAADLGFIGKIDLDCLDRDLIAVPGEALSWRLARDAAVLVRPFYAYKEGEPYYLYLDPAAAKHVSNRGIIFRPHWNAADQLHYTNVVGATAEYAFEGTGIRWRGFKFDDAGRAEVTIDGRLIAIVDQYGPGRNLPFDWSYRMLRPGRHTICLKLMEERTPESADRYLNVASFEALPAPH